jgi:ADP-heptose:LPS heptosyltransferase
MKINDIIINFPSNLGDTILALPVLDRIKSNYPESKITAIASGRTKDLLADNTFVDEVIVFDKTWGMRKKRNFAYNLQGKHQLMVDLKHTLLPILLRIKYRTPFVRKSSKTEHITNKYLKLIEKIAPKATQSKSQFKLSEEKRSHWDNLNINNAVFIACASLSLIKRYPYKNLKIVVENLIKTNPVVIVGTEEERKLYQDILAIPDIIDLAGRTTLADVYYLLKKYAKVVVAVDSSLMHLASYADIPVVALFGPTPPERSLPHSKGSIILQNKNAKCVPCDKPECSQHNECMDIPAEDVISAARKILSQNE